MVSQPGHGSVTVFSNGSFLFTPGANAVATTSFTFAAVDNNNAYSNIGIVTIGITAGEQCRAGVGTP